LEALHSEIERLRRMKQTDGRLSRSNERLLKHYKQLLRELLGAAVIYPEDRRRVSTTEHMRIAFDMGKINSYLKERTGEKHDGKLLHLMLDIFDFDVSPRTILRYYYMSEDEKKTGK
jgi:hypothetical protein